MHRCVNHGVIQMCTLQARWQVTVAGWQSDQATTPRLTFACTLSMHEELRFLLEVGSGPDTASWQGQAWPDDLRQHEEDSRCNPHILAYSGNVRCRVDALLSHAQTLSLVRQQDLVIEQAPVKLLLVGEDPALQPDMPWLSMLSLTGRPRHLHAHNMTSQMVQYKNQAFLWVIEGHCTQHIWLRFMDCWCMAEPKQATKKCATAR